MARATHRLDVYLVPPTTTDDAVQQVADRLARDGARLLERSGAKDARVDDTGTRTLYANQLGGFHVTCSCGAGLARVFQPLGTTVCPSCGKASTFAEVVCRPPAAVGRAALVLMDVDTALFEDTEGWAVVLKRV